MGENWSAHISPTTPSLTTPLLSPSPLTRSGAHGSSTVLGGGTCSRRSPSKPRWHRAAKVCAVSAVRLPRRSRRWPRRSSAWRFCAAVSRSATFSFSSWSRAAARRPAQVSGEGVEVPDPPPPGRKLSAVNSVAVHQRSGVNGGPNSPRLH